MVSMILISRMVPVSNQCYVCENGIEQWIMLFLSVSLGSRFGENCMKLLLLMVQGFPFLRLGWFFILFLEINSIFKIGFGY